MEFCKTGIENIDIINKCIDLGSLCNQTDGLYNPVFQREDFETLLDSSAVFFASSNNEIIGYVGACKVDENILEVCGFVLPQYRYQGIGSKLLEMLFDEYEDFDVLVPIDPKSIDGKNFLESYNAEYESCECAFELYKDYFTKHSANIISGQNQDNNIYVYTTTPFAENNILVHEANLNGNKIGTVSIFYQGDTFTVHNVEIYEDYRGQKLSYLLLYAVLQKEFETHKKAILHVTRENIPAYRLYKKLGFNIYQELEYYSI